MVLIIGQKEDVHIQSVISCSKNTDIKTINYADIPDRLSFTLSFSDKPKASIYCKVTKTTVVDFSQVKSLWVRRISNPQITQLKGATHSYAQSEFNLLLRNINKLFPKIRTLGSPQDQINAQNKAWQKQIAADLGIRTPISYISNDLSYADKVFKDNDFIYIKSFNKKVIPIDKTWPQTILEGLHNKLSGSAEKYEVFNSIRSTMTCLKFRDLKSTNANNSHYPMILEKAIPKKYELRVTVVGEKIFACKIDSQKGSSAGKEDWRTEVDQLPHSKYDLPNEIKQFCLNMLDKLNIKYGAFDFVVTPENEYYFLEVNPSGQWLWIDQKINAGISQAVADFLSDDN